MPAVTIVTPSLESLTSNFPLTYPVPNPVTHADLVTPKDLHREEDLLRNPLSFRHWWSAIQNTKEASSALQKAEGSLDLDPEVAALLGPLASPAARKSLQRLTYLYEAALVQFPNSFKLWKSYLQTRMSFVLGKLIVKKKTGGRKKLPEMREALEDQQEDMEKWEGGLDPVVGWEEWKALIATFERALLWLPKVHTFFRIMKMPKQLLMAALDAPYLVALPLHLQPPVLSSPSLTYARTKNLRPRPAHPPPIPAFSHLGTISSVGREQRRSNDSSRIPPVSRCRSQYH